MSLNIKQQFVTFQQAKKLQELGFEELVYSYFREDGILDTTIVENGSSTDVEFQATFEDLLDNYNQPYFKKGYYSAPEIWQVVEWASMFYNAEIEARPVIFAGDEKASYYQAYLNGVVANLKKFETRQAALLESIDEFLKAQS